MDRLKQLQNVFETVDDEKRDTVQPLLIDIVFMEKRLAELRALPQIKVHSKDPTRQEITPAGKQYKEMMQSYLNAIKVLMTALYRADSSGADELAAKLSEFEL